MVAGGVPEKDDHHASEICKMALDLLAKVYTHGKMGPFKVDTFSRIDKISEPVNRVRTPII